MKKLFIFLTLFFLVNNAFSQLTLKVQVENIRVLGSVDCDAGAGDNSDFVFEFKATDNTPFANSNNAPVLGSIGMCNYAFVSENNGPFNIIPSLPGAAVFSPTTGVFFDRSYPCKKDIPSVITINWRGYENDDVFAPSISPIASGITSIGTQTVGILFQAPYVQSFQYTLTSSDGGCPQTYVINFSVLVNYGAYIPLFIDHIHESTICTAASNGTLEAHPLAGFGAILKDWSNDGLGDYDDPLLISGLTAGTYTFVAKDALNCTDTLVAHIFQINPPTPLSGFTAFTSTVCSGQSGVLFSVPPQVSNTYTWSFSGAGATISGITHSVSLGFSSTATTGTLSVFAQNSCSVTPTLTIQITVHSTPTVVISGNSSVCSNTFAILTASGAPSYTWNTGANTNTISVSPTSTTVYSVNASNFNCYGSQQFTLSVLASPTVQITGSTLAVCPNQTVALNSIGSGSIFIWSDGFIGTNHTVFNSSTTVYTVTNTYTNSCYALATYTLNVSPNPSLLVSGITTICPNKTTTLTATGATNYTWSSGSTTNSTSVSPVSLTTFTVIGTNSLTGCSSTKTVSVNVYSITPISISGSTSVCSGDQPVYTASGSLFYLWNNGATANTNTLTPTGATTISVVGTNSNGCKDSTSLSILIVTTPTISVIGIDSICAGQTIVLATSATAVTSYSWNTGATTSSISIVPISTSTYTVTGINGGCMASDSHTVIVKPTPIVLFLLPQNICSDEPPFILTATPAGGNYNGTSVSGNTFDPSIGLGSYPITYTVANSFGCLASATNTMIVISCVGIEEVGNDLMLNLFPNPAIDKIIIQSEKFIRKLEIFDFTGKLVFTQHEKISGQTIDLTSFVNGMYFFKIYFDENFAKTIKVIKD